MTAPSPLPYTLWTRGEDDGLSRVGGRRFGGGPASAEALHGGSVGRRSVPDIRGGPWNRTLGGQPVPGRPGQPRGAAPASSMRAIPIVLSASLAALEAHDSTRGPVRDMPGRARPRAQIPRSCESPEVPPTWKTVLGIPRRARSIQPSPMCRPRLRRGARALGEPQRGARALREAAPARRRGRRACRDAGAQAPGRGHEVLERRARAPVARMAAA